MRNDEVPTWAYRLDQSHGLDYMILRRPNVYVDASARRNNSLKYMTLTSNPRLLKPNI